MKAYHPNEAVIDQIKSVWLSKLFLHDCQVDTSFVSSERIKNLNAEYRDKNSVTDVLSFPQFDFTNSPFTWENPDNRRQLEELSLRAGSSYHLGDVILCIEVAAKQADDIGHGVDREIAFLLGHGLLHICGHDHEDEKSEKLMLSQQKYLMGELETGKDSRTPLWSGCVACKEGSSGS